MHIIAVGAGPVGEYFVRLAVENGHDVAVIEADETRAEHCAQNYDALVLHAAIDEEGIFEEAGAAQADALIATTDDDSTNLMAMVLGQEYEIASLTSTVNARHRKRLFDRLGVNTLVDPEVLVARHLLDLILHPHAEEVTSLSGEGQVYEFELAGDSKLAGQTLAEISDDQLLPEGTYIVFIKRDEEHLRPRDATRLEAGDNLLVYSREPLSESDVALFTRVSD